MGHPVACTQCHRYGDKSNIAAAVQSQPWRKISLDTGLENVVEPALAEAFFTPGVHYRDGTVTFIRQRPLFETATIGEREVEEMTSAEKGGGRGQEITQI